MDFSNECEDIIEILTGSLAEFETYFIVSKNVKKGRINDDKKRINWN